MALLRRSSSPTAWLVAAAWLVGCAGSPTGPGSPDPLRAWDVAQERFVAGPGLVEELGRHRYVLLGELHDNAWHHAYQARLLRGLVDAGRRPAVVFEMLTADDAPVLTTLRADPETDLPALRRALAWDARGWPDWSLYAPVFQVALDARLPMVGGDLPEDMLDALRREGAAGLGPGPRAALGLDRPASPAERAVLGDAIRTGHCGLLPEAAIPAMVEVQRARDAHLAARLVEATALADVEGAVLIAGAGHVRRDVAVPAWLARLDPDASVASLAFLEADALPVGPAGARALLFQAGAPYDLAVFTEPAPREDPCQALRRRLEGGAHPPTS